jgi:hypothetical protein
MSEVINNMVGEINASLLGDNHPIPLTLEGFGNSNEVLFSHHAETYAAHLLMLNLGIDRDKENRVGRRIRFTIESDRSIPEGTLRLVLYRRREDSRLEVVKSVILSEGRGLHGEPDPGQRICVITHDFKQDGGTFILLLRTE